MERTKISANFFTRLLVMIHSTGERSSPNSTIRKISLTCLGLNGLDALVNIELSTLTAISGCFLPGAESSNCFSASWIANKSASLISPCSGRVSAGGASGLPMVVCTTMGFSKCLGFVAPHGVKSFCTTDCSPSTVGAIVSPTYLCDALKACSSGLPNKVSQAPLLGKISKVPLVWAVPTVTIPVQDPSDRTRFPFAIFRTFTDGERGESCLSMESKVLLSMTLTMAPSSKTAQTLTPSLSSPTSSIFLSNGTSCPPRYTVPNN